MGVLSSFEPIATHIDNLLFERNFFEAVTKTLGDECDRAHEQIAVLAAENRRLRAQVENLQKQGLDILAGQQSGAARGSEAPRELWVVRSEPT